MKRILKIILIAAAALFLLSVLGLLGLKAFTVYQTSRLIDSIADRGYTFGALPAVLPPADPFNGRSIDIGYARVKTPFEKIDTISIAARLPVVVLQSGSVDIWFFVPMTCDQQLLTKYFGPEVHNPDYQPDRHDEQLKKFLRNNGSDQRFMLLHCSFPWWQYGQSMERRSFEDLWTGDAEEINFYLMKLTLLSSPFKVNSTLETDNVHAALELVGEHAVSCRIWDKQHRMYAEFTVRSRNRAGSLEIARQLATTFEFTVDGIPAEDGLAHLLKQAVSVYPEYRERTPSSRSHH